MKPCRPNGPVNRDFPRAETSRLLILACDSPARLFRLNTTPKAIIPPMLIGCPILRFVRCILLLCCLVFAGCMQSSDTSEALSLGADLKVVYAHWVKDGRPELSNVDAYIRSNRRQFFVYTNVVHVGSHSYHCRFGARSQNFQRKGILAISDEQALTWIADSNGEVVVNPQQNPKFDRD